MYYGRLGQLPGSAAGGLPIGPQAGRLSSSVKGLGATGARAGQNRGFRFANVLILDSFKFRVAARVWLEISPL